MSSVVVLCRHEGVDQKFFDESFVDVSGGGAPSAHFGLRDANPTLMEAAIHGRKDGLNMVVLKFTRRVI